MERRWRQAVAAISRSGLVGHQDSPAPAGIPPGGIRVTAPANKLISDDPYATAVRLLQVGANLNLRKAGDLVAKLNQEQLATFAGLADTADYTAVEVVARFMSWSCGELTESDLHDLADAIAVTDPGRWS